MMGARSSRGAVTFQPITFETVRQIIALRVSDEQSEYVAPNSTSICEGLLNPGGFPRAIYADDVPVGFIMLFDPKVPGATSRSPVDTSAVMLWRLMIGEEFQKRGFARQSLDMACQKAARMGATYLLTSYLPGPHGPEAFYLRYGFTRTGATRANGNEIELSLKL